MIEFRCLGASEFVCGCVYMCVYEWVVSEWVCVCVCVCGCIVVWQRDVARHTVERKGETSGLLRCSHHMNCWIIIFTFPGVWFLSRPLVLKSSSSVKAVGRSPETFRNSSSFLFLSLTLLPKDTAQQCSQYACKTSLSLLKTSPPTWRLIWRSLSDSHSKYFLAHNML